MFRPCIKSRYFHSTADEGQKCPPNPTEKGKTMEMVKCDIHVQCIEVILEDNNIAKALAEYASEAAIEFLVLGAASRHGFIRFKASDVPTTVMKAAPDFCTIYVISKGKITSAKKSLKPAPFVSPLYEQIQEQSNITTITNTFATVPPPNNNFNVKGRVQNSPKGEVDPFFKKVDRFMSRDHQDFRLA
ncbi:hypothetical protein L1987_34940 [Smallanthus sonchifolius]|uniref:Uncharacterized protein n=1 Tax=Smallanthus sonchifolius TaxID=185202 RepID=A0ACB9HVZ6_9ASTR|nr:hypothetical protein L1987_34940 [Smallanthus sonchifolius]